MSDNIIVRFDRDKNGANGKMYHANFARIQRETVMCNVVNYIVENSFLHDNVFRQLKGRSYALK